MGSQSYDCAWSAGHDAVHAVRAMRLTNDRIRQALAAEFVLGTLSGRVRRRLQSLMRYDAELRAMVDRWEQRLDPLSAGLTERQPPARAWTSIAARIRAERSHASFARLDRDALA